MVLWLTAAPLAAQEVDTRSELDQLDDLAQPEITPAEQLAARAEVAYAEGNYAEAIELLQLAYAESDNPNMLYNIARVHETAGELRKALAYYRQFSAAPGVDIDYRREALASSAALERQIAEEELAATPEPQAVPDPVVLQRTTTVFVQPAPRSGRALRTLGWVLTGVGVATVAGGAGFGVAALAEQARFDDATTLAARRNHAQTTRHLATAADAMYISGAVLIVTGVVTALAAPRSKAETGASSAASSLRFSLSHDGMGAVWTRSF